MQVEPTLKFHLSLQNVRKQATKVVSVGIKELLCTPVRVCTSPATIDVSRVLSHKEPKLPQLYNFWVFNQKKKPSHQDTKIHVAHPSQELSS